MTFESLGVNKLTGVTIHIANGKKVGGEGDGGRKKRERERRAGKGIKKDKQGERKEAGKEERNGSKQWGTIQVGIHSTWRSQLILEDKKKIQPILGFLVTYWLLFGKNHCQIKIYSKPKSHVL